MNYEIVGISNCSFRFMHSPHGFFFKVFGARYDAHISLELRTDQSGPPVYLTFLEKTPNNVVIQETQEKVAIHLPLSYFDQFYKTLVEALYNKRYKVKLKTEGKFDLTLAYFDFLTVQ